MTTDTNQNEASGNQAKIAHAVRIGIEGKAKVDALTELMVDKGILDANDVTKIDARAIELDEKYRSEL
jgi:hypothetical protein